MFRNILCNKRKLIDRNIALNKQLEEQRKRINFLTHDNQRLIDECWEIHDRYLELLDENIGLKQKLDDCVLRHPPGV